MDLFERLPTPFGLSRYGVAPDHPEVKNCERKFEDIAQDGRFQFFGNTELVDQFTCLENLGAGVTIQNLKRDYDVVILAYGASLDRSLGGLPGENDLLNVIAARQAVYWYNGYPSRDNNFVDLSQVEHVTIIGQGNVALDIARILLTHIDVLAKTDISSRALEGLAQSRVKQVDIIGRRGPLQVAFTSKELREMLALDNLSFHTDESLLLETIEHLKQPGAIESLSNSRMRKKLLELMYKASQKQSSSNDQSRLCSIKFLQSPLAFLAGTPSPDYSPKVGSVQWQLNQLVYPKSQGPIDYSTVGVVSKETSATIVTPTDLVIKSLGYRSTPIDSIPFDYSKSSVRNQHGRVINENNEIIPGLYVTGWSSRGPSGVIANTMYDAFQTMDIIADDLSNQPEPSPRSSHPELINAKYAINWNQWKKIDNEERRRGRIQAKPREKILAVEEMLEIAGIS